MLANAGGRVTLGKSSKSGTAGEKIVPITDASGVSILQLHMISWDAGVVVRMPDNTEVIKLVPGAVYGSLEGAPGPTGKSFQIRWANSISTTCSDFVSGKAGYDIQMIEDGSEVVRLVSATHWWVLPFLTATFCLGACCVHCMQNHAMQVKVKGADVGVLQSNGVLTADEHGALSGALLCAILTRWSKEYAPNAG
ncbi:hypothetical protein TrST_g1295 [Triparma strigata]|uniref:Uncharacterized protein n=1 Tax=Triparma strigata TaxID=1606541 RepID=A0A9W7DRF0_9STRA|nr:hypothetical protein TrST_g1295 [Triparma strigata]